MFSIEGLASWSPEVRAWWLGLVIASAVNIGVWFWIRRARFKGVAASRVLRFWNDPQSVIWLGAFYVFVCAFRAILPRADVLRICLFDTWFSCVFLGRTLATIAELSFVAQWSVILGIAGSAVESSFVRRVSKLILVTIGTAECFSWYAVISTNYLGNSIEESLWGITYFIISVALFNLSTRLQGFMKSLTVFSALGGLVYVGFMFTVDVPMYVGRLLEDMASHKPHLSFVQGIIDLNTHWVVTHDIVDWHAEIPWMTLYFSFAVLVSLGLCLMPLTVAGWKPFLKRRETSSRPEMDVSRVTLPLSK